MYKLRLLIENYKKNENIKAIELYKYGCADIHPYAVKYMIKHFCLSIDKSYKYLFVISDVIEAGFLDIIMNTSEYIKIRLLVINYLDQLSIVGVTYWKQFGGVFSFSVIKDEKDFILEKLLIDCKIDNDILNLLELDLYTIPNIQNDYLSDCECGSCGHISDEIPYGSDSEC
jgi:hypothetical protein